MCLAEQLMTICKPSIKCIFKQKKKSSLAGFNGKNVLQSEVEFCINQNGLKRLSDLKNNCNTGQILADMIVKVYLLSFAQPYKHRKC